MMEMSEEKENIISQEDEACHNDNYFAYYVFPIRPNFSSTMNSLNIIASQSHSPPPSPRLSSLNGRSNSSRRSSIARGIINRNNLNTKSAQEENSSRQQEKHFLRHVHLNDDNRRRMDIMHNSSSSNGSFLPEHIQRDHNVRYSRSSSSTDPNNSPFAGSLRSDGGILSTQKLDFFLDLYEEKHNLESLDKNQVQGLSSNFDMSSSLPLCKLITGTSQDVASYQKTAQILQKDSRKKLIPSPFSSLDLSWLPAATLPQDDIEDKSLSNNNNSSNRDILNSIQRRKQPLSPIKEEPGDVVTNILRNATKNTAAIRKSKVDVDNAEVANTSSVKNQQPQHIGNSKTVNKEFIENSDGATTPDVRIPSSSEPKDTVAQLFPLKSRIPVPLPKTKANRAANLGKSCRSSASSSSGICSDRKSSDNDSSIGSGNTEQQQVQTRAAMEKAEADKISQGNSNNNTFVLKRQILPHSLMTTAKRTSLQANSKPGSSTCIKVPVRTKIGEGDEVSECLNLIDGLSGHTTWVMNKLLEFPTSDEDARMRIKKLKESPGIGDFFGVPYIKKEVLAHLVFNGGISEENVNKNLM